MLDDDDNVDDDVENEDDKEDEDIAVDTKKLNLSTYLAYLIGK